MKSEIEPFVDEVKKSVEVLRSFNYDSQHTMTINIFRSLNKEQKIAISGIDTDDWTEFKANFREKQQLLGFSWTPYQGYAGPLGLDKVFVPDSVAQSIAKMSLAAGIKEGALDSIINEQITHYLKYGVSPDLTSARKIFSEYEHGTQKFAFVTNSNTFRLVTKSYEFPGSGKKGKNRTGENDFCSLIEPMLRSRFMNSNLRYTQTERQMDKYQNIDFAGYSISDRITSINVEVIAIEAKSSNTFEKVSEAIRQSINYKQIANQVYILIPMFDAQSFHDFERFEEYRKQCESHGIGIISVDMDTKEHRPKNIQIVLDAKSFEISKTSLLRNLLDEDAKSLCPLCRRIVGKDNSNCGWQIPRPDDAPDSSPLCMRERMEYSALREYKQSQIM